MHPSSMLSTDASHGGPSQDKFKPLGTFIMQGVFEHYY